jgi:hypothetical protein
VKARNGSRGYFGHSSDEEWIDLDRLREIIEDITALGGTKITPVDLLNRLGIEDEELDPLKGARRLGQASPHRQFLAGTDDLWAPGRRKAKPADS